MKKRMVEKCNTYISTNKNCISKTSTLYKNHYILWYLYPKSWAAAIMEYPTRAAYAVDGWKSSQGVGARKGGRKRRKGDQRRINLNLPTRAALRGGRWGHSAQGGRAAHGSVANRYIIYVWLYIDLHSWNITVFDFWGSDPCWNLWTYFRKSTLMVNISRLFETSDLEEEGSWTLNILSHTIW